MQFIRVKPPRISAILLGASVSLHFLLLHGAAPAFQCIPCGALLSSAGFGVMMWAWWLFRRRGNPICPTDSAHEVISAGPYRVSRNPMYLGMLAILAGATLVMGSIPALIAPVGFFLVMHSVFIPYEENSMQKLFGPTYRQYQAQVRRWF